MNLNNTESSSSSLESTVDTTPTPKRQQEPLTPSSSPRRRRQHRRLQKTVSSLDELMAYSPSPDIFAIAHAPPTLHKRSASDGVPTLFDQTKDLSVQEREALFGAIINPNNDEDQVVKMISRTLSADF